MSLSGIIALPDMISDIVTFLFGFFGIAVVALIAVFSARIMQTSDFKIATLSVACLMLGAVIAILFAIFAERNIISRYDMANSRVEHVVMPLHPKGQLKKSLESSYKNDARDMLNSSSQSRELLIMIDQQNDLEEALTIAMLTLCQILLILGATLALWRASLDEQTGELKVGRSNI